MTAVAAIKKGLEKYGVHTFLLPVYYLLHTYLYYSGLVSGRATLVMLAGLELAFIACFGLLWLLGRRIDRSLVTTTLLGCILLFYGAIKDFFDDTLRWHAPARWFVLPPLLLLLSVWLMRTIWRKSHFDRLHLFLNAWLLVLIAFDTMQLLTRNASDRLQQNPLVTSRPIHPDTRHRPGDRHDVYFLVFDSYPGDSVLLHYLQYDNGPFTHALRQRGFRVLANPRSNYNRTQFSIACTFNINYLNGLSTHAQSRHYNQALRSIEQSAVPRAFLESGYTLYNLSIFNLPDHPALKKENFLALPENEMLLYNTLPGRFAHDIGWHFPLLARLLPLPSQSPELYRRNWADRNDLIKSFNQTAIDSLLHIPAETGAAPKFVYAHLYLPHIPLSYDSNGHPVANTGPLKPAEEKAAVISYLKYTNKVVLQIVDSILQHGSRQPVIIVQSDHGYRDLGKDVIPPAAYFDNYSAFYFPDGNYTGLYDTLSNINSFAIVFNKYFNTHLPLQKDSIIALPFP